MRRFRVAHSHDDGACRLAYHRQKANSDCRAVRKPHRVELIGAGTIFGKPWVLHKSDSAQGNNAAGTGLGADLSFSFLRDTDNDGRLNLIYNGLDANIHSVFTQSPAPVGGTTELLVGDSEATSQDSASEGGYVVIVAAIAAGGVLIVLAGGGLYARRRWMR